VQITMSKAELASYLDEQNVLIGGNPMFFAEYTGDIDKYLASKKVEKANYKRRMELSEKITALTDALLLYPPSDDTLV
jgi:hypothetical protein